MHAAGEDLKTALMSMEDLLAVASYHFRKSYLGVLQTVKSRPEISERLLLNQFGWMNTLLRLYKTQEKLSRKPVIKTRKEELPEAVISGEELPQPKEKAPLSSGKEPSAFSDSPAISEAGAYSAPRAYSALEPAKSASAKHAKTEKRQTGEAENTPDPSTEIVQTQNRSDSPVIPPQPEMSGKSPDNSIRSSAEPAGDGTSGTAPEPEDTEGQVTAPSLPPDDPESEEILPESGNPPGYLKILNEVERRRVENNERSRRFTFREIQLLLSDPEFCSSEPDLAAGFLRAIRNYHGPG
jgi:hypothetical protein